MSDTDGAERSDGDAYIAWLSKNWDSFGSTAEPITEPPWDRDASPYREPPPMPYFMRAPWFMTTSVQFSTKVLLKGFTYAALFSLGTAGVVAVWQGLMLITNFHR